MRRPRHAYRTFHLRCALCNVHPVHAQACLEYYTWTNRLLVVGNIRKKIKKNKRLKKLKLMKNFPGHFLDQQLTINKVQKKFSGSKICVVKCDLITLWSIVSACWAINLSNVRIPTMMNISFTVSTPPAAPSQLSCNEYMDNTLVTGR